MHGALPSAGSDGAAPEGVFDLFFYPNAHGRAENCGAHVDRDFMSCVWSPVAGMHPRFTLV